VEPGHRHDVREDQARHPGGRRAITFGVAGWSWTSLAAFASGLGYGRRARRPPAAGRLASRRIVRAQALPTLKLPSILDLPLRARASRARPTAQKCPFPELTDTAEGDVSVA